MTSQWHRVNFGFLSSLDSILDFTHEMAAKDTIFPALLVLIAWAEAGMAAAAEI